MNNKVEYEFQFETNNGEDEILKKLNNISTAMDKIEKANMTTPLKNANKEVGKSIPKDSIFSAVSIASIVYGFSRMTNAISNFARASAGMTENINLTTVAFYDNSKSLEQNLEYVDELANMYDNLNLNESNVLRGLGIFKQMANAMELPLDTGAELSELMTKMSYDISSLYNISLEQSQSALESALVGQTRPIRGATGADITENTLERTVEEVVPDRYIRDLSYVEKRLIMVISLTNQLKVSQGDFARTIESPANQMRILAEQIERVSIAIGNFLMPIISAVLPYLNAFMIVLEVVINALARLVGFEQPEFDYSGVSDSALDLEEQLNATTESANELKKGLRGFDKLNVISSSDSTGAGSGLGTGIDPDILDAFYKASDEYNDMMDSVVTKATQLSDSFLKWIGFTKDLNGEWQFAGVTLGTVITAIGGIAIGLGAINKAWQIASGFFGIFSTGSLAKQATTTSTVFSKLLLPALVAIATVWTIDLYVRGVKSIMSEIEGLKTQLDGLNTTVDNVAGNTKTYNNELKTNVEQGNLSNEQIQYHIEYLTRDNKRLKEVMKTTKESELVLFGFNINGKEVNETLLKQIDIMKTNADSMWTLYQTGQLTSEQTRILEEDLFFVINTLKQAGQNTSELETRYKELTGSSYNVVQSNYEQILSMHQLIAQQELLGKDTSKLREEFKLLTGQDWNIELESVFIDGISIPFDKAMGSVQEGIIATTKLWGSLGAGVNRIFDLGTEWKSNSTTVNIPGFANGGMPSAGQLFIANEAGPEVVSTLGGKSVVANMEQMMGYIDRRIDTKAGKNNSGSGETFVFNMGNREMAKYTLQEIKNMSKENGQPIRL